MTVRIKADGGSHVRGDHAPRLVFTSAPIVVRGSVLPNMQQAKLAGRTCLGWLWQNDPLFRIRYNY